MEYFLCFRFMDIHTHTHTHTRSRRNCRIGQLKRFLFSSDIHARSPISWDSYSPIGSEQAISGPELNFFFFFLFSFPSRKIDAREKRFPFCARGLATHCSERGRERGRCGGKNGVLVVLWRW